MPSEQPDRDIIQAWKDIAEAYYEIGEEYERRGDLDKALKWYEKITSNGYLNSSTVVFRDTVAKATYRAQRITIDKLHKEGKDAYRRGKWVEAKDIFSRIPTGEEGYEDVDTYLKLANDELDFEKHYKEGREYSDRKEWLQAIESFRLAAKFKPTDKNVHNSLKGAEKQKRRLEYQDRGDAAYEGHRWEDVIEAYTPIINDYDNRSRVKEARRELEAKRLHAEAMRLYDGGSLWRAKRRLDKIRKSGARYTNVANLSERVEKEIEKQRLTRPSFWKRLRSGEFDRAIAMISIVVTVISIILALITMASGSPSPQSIPPIPTEPTLQTLRDCLIAAEASITATDSYSGFLGFFREEDSINLTSETASFQIVLDSPDCPELVDYVKYVWISGIGEIWIEEADSRRASYTIPIGAEIDALSVLAQLPDLFQKPFSFKIIKSRE